MFKYVNAFVSIELLLQSFTQSASVQQHIACEVKLGANKAPAVLAVTLPHADNDESSEHTVTLC